MAVGSVDLGEWLMSLGFSRREALILSYIVNNGSATVGELSSTTGVARPHIYTIVGELVRKGYLVKVQGRPSRYLSYRLAERLQVLLEERYRKSREILQLLGELTNRLEEPTILYEHRAAFMRTLLEHIDSSRNILWIAIPSTDLIERGLRGISKARSRSVDVRIATSDLNYVKRFLEMPSFVRYIQPPPPFLLALVDGVGFFSPILDGGLYVGVLTRDPALLARYREYFDHIWRDDYVRTLYKLRMTTPKEY